MDFLSLAPAFHWVFLGLMTLCIVALLLWWRSGGNRRFFIGLNLFFALAFAGLLTHQAYWQLGGGASLDFQKFQRRYDMRPATVARNAEGRGRLLDRRNTVLAQARKGHRWGHETLLGAAGLHVVGYSSREFGLSGLERVFDTQLCGFSLKPLASRAVLERPQPQDVRTTLDARLQRVAFDALNGRRGAVVILDPRNGELLALVSSPSSDERALRSAMNDSARAPLFNRATQGLYAPGSTFKIFTAALALKNRKATRYVCPAMGWEPGAYTAAIRDSHPTDDSDYELPRAFAESSNIYFAKAAVACGWNAFSAEAQQLGLARGFTLASCGERSFGAVSGIVPDLSQTPNRLAYLGFGQGDLRLTPLHIAALTATIANDGVLCPPHLILNESEAASRIWSKAIAAQVKALMRGSVTTGTSRAIAIEGLDVCGKTGTAENAGRDHAWFTCFAPAQHPRIVITVLVENGGFGAASALPIAKTLLKTWQSFRPTARTSN
ncbi:MAG: penicillin-binding transpeptidase domain-containing protein [Kiritimatiellia bacterium]